MEDFNIKYMERPACAICHGHDTESFPWGIYHLSLLPPIGVSQCKQCGMIFLSPRPNRELRRSLMQGIMPDALQAYSPKTANYAAVTASRAELFKQRLRILKSVASQKCKPRELALLDIGASAGTLVQQARFNGWNAYGVEPSVGGTNAAAAQGVQLAQGVAETLPFANDIFDVVHSHHVFEHLADPLQAAQEAWRVLKPGGFLFLEVPNQLDNIMFRRDILLRRVPQRQRNIRSIHHLWFFSRRTLAKLLERSGFTNIKVKDVYSWPPIGWRTPFSLATRAVGVFAYGGQIVQAYAFKPQGVNV